MIEVHIPNFLSDYDGFRDYCDHLDYNGVVNPADGVFYPGVSIAIPENIKAEVKAKIEEFVGSVTINAIFLRLSTEGMVAPHQAHTDALMGQYSLMLYLNRPEHCVGGTSLVQHVSGMYSTPLDEEGLKAWERDHSNPDMWKIYYLCKMETNKAFIFDANLMHRSEPIGGFGDSPYNGRLVLTAFFNENP